MRRQLLEHQRYWRGNAANSPSPSLRDMPPTGTDSPGTAVTPPVTVVPLGTTRIGTTPLGATLEPILLALQEWSVRHGPKIASASKREV